MQAKDRSARTNQILDWLRPRVAAAVGVHPDSVGLDDSFFGLGLESRPATMLADEIGTFLGVRVDPLVLFNHPTLAELSAHLEHRESLSAGA